MANYASPSTQPTYFKNYAQPYPTQYSSNGLTIRGGGYDPKKKIEELNAQFLGATNPSKIGATNSEYGMTIATTPYKTQEQISKSQLNTAQFQSGLRLQPMQEKADYGGLRNKSFGQDDDYAGGIEKSAMDQIRRNRLSTEVDRKLKMADAGTLFNPKQKGGAGFTKGMYETPEQKQDLVSYLRQLQAMNKAASAASPYQYQAPAPNIPFDNGTKKGYYK